MRHKYCLIVSIVLLAMLGVAPHARAQKVVEDSWQQLRIEFSLPAGDALFGNSDYGWLPSSEVGEPCLPTYSTLIEVPFCAGYAVTVSNATYDTLDVARLSSGRSALWLSPVQPPRSKSDTAAHPLVKNLKTYTSDAFYGVALASVEAVGIARDRQLARLQFSPVRYNPVSNQVIVCRNATVEVHYLGSNPEATLAHFGRYHTPAFGGITVLNNLYPKAVSTTAPVRYLIVSHSMFRGLLDGFAQWKRRKGFLVDIAYTDSSAVGNTCASIQSFIQSQYTDATATNPAPTYLLLVGDHEQIPAFEGTTDDDHITDLYYTTWTQGDNIPDCYHGRFSAQTEAQLVPQIAKTLMYEQYTFADPSFLDRAVMVAGVDRGEDGDHGYNYADPTMDYAIQHYVNGGQGFSQVYYYKNNTSVVPAGTNITVAGNSDAMSATVRDKYNQGAGLINYTAHGSSTSWGTPNFTTTHAANMTNNQKFGLMIGNCCLTNKFETATCLGEAVLRKGNYCGAVGYIGGSNSTYWGEDFYWSVGVRNSISATMSLNYNSTNLGAYDRLFHTHGESHDKWVTTQGSLMFQGNMTVESSTSGLKLYYWEIYHLMGDPSLMPYMTQADTMSISAPTVTSIGTTSIPVTAAPYSYLALVDTTTNQLKTSAFADGNGHAILSIPTNLLVGTYRLAASAQQYRTAFVDIDFIQPDGAFTIVSAANAAPLNSGDTVALTITFQNIGTATAHNIVAQLSSNNPRLTLSSATVILDSLAAGDTVVLTDAVNAFVADDTPDNATANLSIAASWSDNAFTSDNMVRMTLYAPVLSISFSQPMPSMNAGSTMPLTATLRNTGHAPGHIFPLTLTPTTSLLTATSTAPFAMAPNSDTTLSLTLHADSLLPQHITIPMHYRYSTIDGELPVYLGQAYLETFEGSTMNLNGFANDGAHPWVVTDSLAYEGSHCMRSAAGLSNYDISEMQLSVNVATPDSLSFYYRVSSERNYDKFHFSIDGAEQFDASGETEWEHVSYFLTTGTHTLTFRYEKDVSWDRGSDCVWIDNIILPHQSKAVAFQHDSLCEGAFYMLFDDTIDTHEPTSGAAILETSWMVTIVDYTVLAPVFDTIALDVHDNSFQWNDNIYTASGMYTQVFPTTYGCDSTVTLVLTLLGPQGIADRPLPAPELRLHPNPTSGSVALSEPATELRIYDMMGRQVACLHHVQRLDLGHLPKGVYTLRASIPAGVATLRLVLQ